MTYFGQAAVRENLHAKIPQSCLILCDPMDCTPLGSSVRGILQPVWAAMSSSGDLSDPANLTPHALYLLHWQLGSLRLAPPSQLQMWVISYRKDRITTQGVKPNTRKGRFHS